MPSAYERRIQNYLASHPGATRAEARGHGQTPEHGGVLSGTPRHITLGAHDIHRSYSDDAAEKQIYRASNHEDARVQLMVHTKANGWQTIGGTRGYTAPYLAEQVHKAGYLRGAIQSGALHGGQGNNSDTVDDASEIDAWQIDEIRT
jgi:hypothetical protein